MKPIDNWKQAWTFFSNWAFAAIFAWTVMPAEHQEALVSLLPIAPDRVPAVLAVIGIFARMVKQKD